jgi:hypothetical protein
MAPAAPPTARDARARAAGHAAATTPSSTSAAGNGSGALLRPVPSPLLATARRLSHPPPERRLGHPPPLVGGAARMWEKGPGDAAAQVAGASAAGDAGAGGAAVGAAARPAPSGVHLTECLQSVPRPVTRSPDRLPGQSSVRRRCGLRAGLEPERAGHCAQLLHAGRAAGGALVSLRRVRRQPPGPQAALRRRPRAVRGLPAPRRLHVRPTARARRKPHSLAMGRRSLCFQLKRFETQRNPQTGGMQANACLPPSLRCSATGPVQPAGPARRPLNRRGVNLRTKAEALLLTLLHSHGAGRVQDRGHRRVSAHARHGALPLPRRPAPGQAVSAPAFAPWRVHGPVRGCRCRPPVLCPVFLSDAGLLFFVLCSSLRIAQC